MKGTVPTWLAGVIVAFASAFWSAFGSASGQSDMRNEWRECRTLLTTQDSTAVLAARPACAQWTWPPKEGTR